MSLKLDRLQRSTSLVDGNGLPSSQFQVFWQRVMEAIEGSINNITDMLTRLGVVEAAAEDIREDLEEIEAAPVILRSANAKFPNGLVATEGSHIDLTAGSGSLTFSLADSGVAAGDYGSSTEAVGLTIDDKGVIVAATAYPLTAEGLGGVPDTRQVIAGAGLTGGGDLTDNRTFDVGAGTGISVTADAVSLDTSNSRNVDHSSVSISAGAGLVGGGTIALSRTLSLGTSGVTAGSYGSATKVPTLTVDVYGRVTIASENTIPALASGTYTPTFTAVANVDALTGFSAQYMRVGDVVTVSGQVNIDPTTAATLTQVGISLPIASNFANNNECAGTGFTPGVAGQGCAIVADFTNDRAEIRFICSDTSSRGMYFTFTYRVLP